jgi:hypothetical protein
MDKMSEKPRIHALFATIVLLVLAGLSCQSISPRVTLPPGTVPVRTQPAMGTAEPALPMAATLTSTPSIGAARSNPAPPGSNVGVYTIFISVLDAIRPADDLVEAANPSNPRPGEGMQYMFVEVALLCDLTSDSTCSLSPSDDFRLVGSSGVLIEPTELPQAPDGMLQVAEFFGGSSISGYVPFIISKAETDLILVFSPSSALGMIEGYLMVPNG